MCCSSVASAPFELLDCSKTVAVLTVPLLVVPARSRLREIYIDRHRCFSCIVGLFSSWLHLALRRAPALQVIVHCLVEVIPARL